jgi:hypothetical protein
MRSGFVRSFRALSIVPIVVVFLVSAAAVAVAGSGSARDGAVARSGLLTTAELPAGFKELSAPEQSHTDNIRLARNVDGCKPYVDLQQSLVAVPQARSSRFADATRTVGNEVDVFQNAKAAGKALATYAKPSIVGCLEHLFEKQVRQDASLNGKLKEVMVSLDRQDIAGLGDDSVVYEGTIELTGTDGSTTRVGIGNAAVQVGRAVDVIAYTTSGADLTEILAPAIDASVARLRAALT